MNRLGIVDRKRSDRRDSSRHGWQSRSARLVFVLLGVVLLIPSTGCYTKRMELMEGKIDTLRIEIGEMQELRVDPRL